MDLSSQWSVDPRMQRHGAVLGDLLSGNVGTPGTYDAAFKGMADADYQFQKARRETARAMMAQGAAEEYESARRNRQRYAVALGLSPEAYGLSLINPDDILGGAVKGQEMAFRQAAAEAAGRMYGPDNPNAPLFGLANGPQPLATVQGDTILGNRYVPGGDVEGLTPLGEARAASSRAQAQSTADRLRIALQQFELQRTGQWNPSGRAPASAPTGSWKRTAPSEAGLKRAFERADPANQFAPPTFDQPRYLDFERWWAAHPWIADGNQALAQYQMDASTLGGPGPLLIDPTFPGSMTVSPPAPARPQSKVDYDALPSGTQFIAPDGTMRIKP